MRVTVEMPRMYIANWSPPPQNRPNLRKKATFIVTLKQAIYPIAFTVVHIMHTCALRNQEDSISLQPLVFIHRYIMCLGQRHGIKTVVEKKMLADEDWLVSETSC